jgi:ABC-2 type transport system permease protein
MMRMLKSWRALLVREYLEHRMAFVYFPVGILVLFALSAGSGLVFNRVRFVTGLQIGNTLKMFELGYIILIALWLAYLAVALFFYFGDAFSADRRNNAMFFWKSMPLSDLKIVASKFFAGILLFPAIILIVAAVTGLVFFAIVNVAPMVLAGLFLPDPIVTLRSFGQITLFALVYLFFAVLWYAPFLAWVGGLSTIFGRWSLPLAFVIPGFLSVIENMLFFGTGPRGGYIWSYLGHRWQFGLSDIGYAAIVTEPTPFGASSFIQLLLHQIDWVAMGGGLVFAAVVLYLASQYRRRRIN